MTDASIDEQRFSETEVREIIERASETTPEREFAQSRGLSLAELKDIGREVGIDAARLEEAAREVARRPKRTASAIVGAPRRLGVERTVAGIFDPADTPEVLAAIRATLGAQAGEVKELRGSLEWSEAGEVHNRHVTISSSGGVTTIRGSSNLANARVSTFAGGVAVTAVGTVLPTIVLEELFDTGGLPLLVVPLFLLPVVYMLARLILGKLAESEADRLEEVADRLEAFAKPDPQ